MTNFWDISANVQIAVGLLLVVILLTIIIFKLSTGSSTRSKSAKRGAA